MGQDYEHFSKVTLKNEFLKLLEAYNSPHAVAAFNEAVGAFPSQIISAHRKATEELTTLKILGSKKLLELTGQFEVINQEILEASTAWLKEMKVTFEGDSIELPAAKELTALGERAKALRSAIITQMRVEIGLGA